MFLVIGVVYVIRYTISFLTTRIIGIKSLASLEITIRVVLFEGLYRIYLIRRCR
jgi:hypothetical protein